MAPSLGLSALHLLSGGNKTAAAQFRTLSNSVERSPQPFNKVGFMNSSPSQDKLWDLFKRYCQQQRLCVALCRKPELC